LKELEKKYNVSLSAAAAADKETYQAVHNTWCELLYVAPGIFFEKNPFSGMLDTRYIRVHRGVDPLSADGHPENGTPLSEDGVVFSSHINVRGAVARAARAVGYPLSPEEMLFDPEAVVPELLGHLDSLPPDSAARRAAYRALWKYHTSAQAHACRAETD